MSRRPDPRAEAIARGLPWLPFDDGPSAHTEAMLEILAAREIRATFFVLGVRARERPDVIRRIHRSGHELANHGERHLGFDSLTPGDLRAELEPLSDRLEHLTQRPPTKCRSPYLEHTRPHVHEVAAALGLGVVDCDVDPRDWERPGAEAIATAIKAAAPGAIVLLHDGAEPGCRQPDRSQTVAAVRRWVESAGG